MPIKVLGKLVRGDKPIVFDPTILTPVGTDIALSAGMESRKSHHDKVMTADPVSAPAGSTPSRRNTRVGPRVHVVVLSEGTREDLVAALNAAAPLCRSLAISVSVVVESEALTRHLQLSFPGVQFLMVSPGLPEEERRTMALRAAGGDLVAFTRESAVLNGGWRQALSRQAGLSDEPPDEPSAEWARRLAQLGVPGALGDI